MESANDSQKASTLKEFSNQSLNIVDSTENLGFKETNSIQTQKFNDSTHFWKALTSKLSSPWCRFVEIYVNTNNA